MRCVGGGGRSSLAFWSIIENPPPRRQTSRGPVRVAVARGRRGHRHAVSDVRAAAGRGSRRRACRPGRACAARRGAAGDLAFGERHLPQRLLARRRRSAPGRRRASRPGQRVAAIHRRRRSGGRAPRRWRRRRPPSTTTCGPEYAAAERGDRSSLAPLLVWKPEGEALAAAERVPHHRHLAERTAPLIRAPRPRSGLRHGERLADVDRRDEAVGGC